MGAENHPEVVAAVKDGNGFAHKKTLIFAAIVAGALVVLVIAARAWVGTQRDVLLCEKLDRFVVVIERGVMASTTLTPQEKQDRLKLYEDFRNDTPTCRTPGP